MNWKDILQVVEIIAMIVGGFAISYFRTSSVFRGFIAELIADAEEQFSNVEKAGAEKMAWVIAQIYAFIPAWLKPFLTTEKIQAIVQAVFDNIKAFADIQVLKLKAKYEADLAERENQARIDIINAEAAAYRKATGFQDDDTEEKPIAVTGAGTGVAAKAGKKTK